MPVPPGRSGARCPRRAGGSRPQRELGDFGRTSQPQRKARPQAGAVADVQQHVPHPVLTLGAGVNWQSRTYTTTSNAATNGRIEYGEGSYAVANLMARYQINKQLSAQLNVDNVFDKKYRNQLSFNQYSYGDPRSIKDVINEYASKAEQADTLIFADAQSGHAHFGREGNDLVIKAYGEEDRVAIRHYFYSDSYIHHNLQFADKTLNVEDMKKVTFTFHGTDKGDSTRRILIV